MVKDEIRRFLFTNIALRINSMDKDFDTWYKGYVAAVNWCLKSFFPRNSPTGSNKNWRRYYVADKTGRERFVLHIRPVPTKRRVNLCFGLSEAELDIPSRCPPLELRDESHSGYREFDVVIDDGLTQGISLYLICQVATILSGR